ncbi:MAG: FadR family transcriptional regulator [Mycobacterium sp.]|nr:FadR family transcriptional regulator [Mycobacterium sp.]
MAGSWERIRPIRASDEIVRQVRHAIFEGRLVPGDVVGSENGLADEFGVSRNTVRDALRALEASGAVEIRIGVKGGVRVAQPDPLRFADALAVQLALVGIDPSEAATAQLGLEWVGAELAADHATPQHLKQLELLLEQSARLVDDSPAFAESSQAFHDVVAEASANWAIISSLRALREITREVRARHTSPTMARRVQQFHQAIYEAVRDGDAEKAGQIMRQHMSLTARSRQPAGRARAAAH